MVPSLAFSGLRLPEGAIANLDDAMRVRGDFLRHSKLVNGMVTQLAIFSSEVTRVAQQVGVEGKLGAQASVRGVAGVFKELTDHLVPNARMVPAGIVAVSRAQEHGYTRLSMSNMRILGFIDATRFNSTEGRARLVQAIDYAVEHEFVWDIIPGKYLLAIVEQQRGDVESARAALREVLTLAVQHGHRKYTQDSEAGLRELDVV